MTSASTKRRHAKALAIYRKCKAWPVGKRVTVRRANGETLHTVTESGVWYSAGCAYVTVRGIPGNTRLDRVTRLTER